MWKKTHSVVTKAVTGEQIWRLFADVNNWHIWDDDIEYAHLQGKFEKGNFILLKPRGGPKVKIELVELHPNSICPRQCRFFTLAGSNALAKGY
ncbi:MAG TPA: hypothetical protein VL053_08305 [Arachidicoccus sp.]|nr:hypothetical protein [Arachidicoccus sp.]